MNSYSIEGALLLCPRCRTHVPLIIEVSDLTVVVTEMDTDGRHDGCDVTEGEWVALWMDLERAAVELGPDRRPLTLGDPVEAQRDLEADRKLHAELDGDRP